MTIAITREVSTSIARCELTHRDRRPIDLDRCREQHAVYEETLTQLGCRVLRLAEEPALPDSVFVEDCAIVLDELAVITRPGAASRRPEVASVAEALRPHRPLAFIEAPATLDGGDVLRVGRTLYVGQTARTNAAAVDQLRTPLAAWGYRIQAIPISGCLHLKSAVTQVAERTVLLQPAWVNAQSFGDLEVLEVDRTEPDAANGLLLHDTLIYSSTFPRTAERLRDRGIRVIPIDLSELAKAEGAVTCCSLIVEP